MSKGTVLEIGMASRVDRERPFRAGAVINLVLLLIISLLAAAAVGCGGDVNTESVAPIVPGSGSAVGSATLAWTAPKTNADGSLLTDLAGYKIYYGAAPGVYSKSIDVGNNTSYQVDNLTVGTTYYFTVTAYNTSGNESDYATPPVNKTIN